MIREIKSVPVFKRYSSHSGEYRTKKVIIRMTEWKDIVEEAEEFIKVMQGIHTPYAAGYRNGMRMILKMAREEVEFEEYEREDMGRALVQSDQEGRQDQ